MYINTCIYINSIINIFIYIYIYYIYIYIHIYIYIYIYIFNYKYMVLQCSKLLYYKVSSEFLRQDSQSSYSFGKIQNVGETTFWRKKISVLLDLLKKDFIFRFHMYFSASFASNFLLSDTQSRTSAMISFNIELWRKSSIIGFVHKIWRCHSHLRESAKDGSPK